VKGNIDELQTAVETELCRSNPARRSASEGPQGQGWAGLGAGRGSREGYFLLLQGRLSVGVGGKVLAELGPGSVVGERAVVDAGLQTSTVPVTVLVLQRPAFAVGEREELKAGNRTSTLNGANRLSDRCRRP
jgi:hypothetical protein